jgi:ABC-type nitrate/sulfonate/bicarbonate transport system substrate-binding protein
MYHRWLGVVPAVASLLGAALACSSVTVRAAEPVQLQLAVQGVAAYPAYIAEHLGYFDEEGIEVDVVPGTCHHLPHVCRASTNLVQQVSTGKILIGWGVPAAVLPAAARGEKLKFFYTYGVRSFFDVVVPDDSPIRTVAELRGKTVGITDLGYGELPFVRGLLGAGQLRPGDSVTIVALEANPSSVLASLREGTVQAVGGSVEELAALYRAGFKGRSLAGEYRELPSSGIFVTESTFNGRRDVLVKVARPVARATLFALTNPEAAAAIMAQMVPRQFGDAEAGRALLRTYLELSTPQQRDRRGEPVFGYAMPDGWQRLQGILLAGDRPVLPEPADLARVVIGELIPEINRFDRDKVRQRARAFKP